MNHHFNFLYIFFFMLIIVLKDKCDFNIHAYWFIFSFHIWKNSKEILFLCRFISVSVWNPKQVKTSSVGKMILLAVLYSFVFEMKKCCSQCLNQQLHVLFINVFWCQSKKNHSQIIAFCKNTHKQKIIYHIWNEIGAEFTSWFMHIVFDIENEFLLILPLLTGFF